MAFAGISFLSGMRKWNLSSAMREKKLKNKTPCRIKMGIG
jgi:hypothetical protein